jgi:SAM-dependent methyltransferase
MGVFEIAADDMQIRRVGVAIDGTSRHEIDEAWSNFCHWSWRCFCITFSIFIVDKCGGSSVLRNYVRSLRQLSRSVRRAFGKFPRECPLCGFHGHFLGYGYPYVCDVYCPKCGSLERHRLLYLADWSQDYFSSKDVLHFAPEQAVTKLIKARQPKSYITADLFAEGVDRKENIEALTIDDQSFDVVVCLHVLEHVDDRAAVSELYRVLRPGGLLIAMFPIVEGWPQTFEDPSKSTEVDRLLFFGQHDHARYFGRDARQRLAAPGFTVDEFTAVEPDVSRYGLARGEKIFLCRRPAAV